MFGSSAEKKACVIGMPIAHSLSPKIHNYWFKRHHIAGNYEAREVVPAELKAALGKLVDQGFAGCNITLPLKEQTLPLMDELDKSAVATGAVNTVVFKRGRKIGYNSDGFGFIEGLKEYQRNWNGAHVVIFGAGGAARGVAYGLKEAKAKRFTLINRTPAKAEKLAEELKLPQARVLPWEKYSEALNDATLLINCTSLGMMGYPFLQIDISALPKTTAVCDIVYRPLVTRLLKDAQERGHPTIKGLPMLLHQGRLGFRLWFNKDPDVTTELYEEIAACAK